MSKKKTKALCSLALAIVCQSASAQPAFTGKSASDQKTLMKNWALSACFARMAKDPETKNDASSTASAFLENSQQDIEDFEKLGKLVDEYLALQYGGSVKSEYNTMKCIDLFHSKKLDQLAAKLVKRR
jgi:hypothetical protein